MNTDSNETKKYNAEAQERWGHSPEYKEYSQKTKRYSKEKWASVTEGLNGIFEKFAIALKSSLTFDSAEVQMIVKALQDYITENYYHCSNEILCGLGQMYILDERFKNNIDKHGEGTADFVSKAIELYCIE